MSSMNTTFRNALCALIMNATAMADYAENDSSAPLAAFQHGLHTSSPGVSGNQGTNEISYTSYARASANRNSGGYTCTDNVANPTSNISFPAGTGGSGTATHLGIGRDASGTGTLDFNGSITPNIVCGDGVTPIIGTSTSLTFT